jgi:ribosome-binding ATPase YchF (GTP1/OBG family)
LGNAFLSHIAAVDGIFHLVRAFDSDEVIHVDDSVDPIRDLETIQAELCLKDADTLTKVIEKEKERIRKEKGIARSADVPLGETFQSAYEKCKKLIESNTPVQTCEDFSMGEVDIIRDFGLITTKPQIYVVNMSKRNFLRKGSKWLPKIQEWVNSHGGGQIIPMSCEFEQELMDLGDDEEAKKSLHPTMRRGSKGNGSLWTRIRCQICSTPFDSFWPTIPLFAIILHCRTKGSACLDNYEGHCRTAGSWCYSHRFRARVY